MKYLAIIFMIPLASCTSAKISKSLSSGAIGCPTQQIMITNETVSSGVHNFTATCNGVSHYCTYMYPNPISCKAASSN